MGPGFIVFEARWAAGRTQKLHRVIPQPNHDRLSASVVTSLFFMWGLIADLSTIALSFTVPLACYLDIGYYGARGHPQR